MSRPADPLGDVSEQKKCPTRTSGMAIASLVLGLLSFCLSLFILTGIPAIILGALSLRAIKRSGGRVSGKTLLSNIRDGTSSTIGVVHSSRKVHWASPDDLVVDVKKPLNLADFKNSHSGGFQAMFLDGSISFIKLSTPEMRIRSLLSIAGDEEIPQGRY